MKRYFVGFWYSLPIQLFLLHFRRYQLLLLFWYILFATIAGHFMRTFGANSLYLAPEYFDEVNILSSAFVGMSVGVFIMSWNITTFILHTVHIKFLATTAQPFLKYCINNAIIPLCFLVTYLVLAIEYNKNLELRTVPQIAWLVVGFLSGLVFSILVAFLYFFSADKRIYRTMASAITTANKKHDLAIKKKNLPADNAEIRVDWFLSARLGLRKPRDVRHYSFDFFVSVFKRHHVAAVIAIFVAFIFLVGIGFISDKRLFQIPAAASITVFFAVLVATAGAFSMFLRSWSLPMLLVFYLIVNYLYKNDIIDPRNKAYGLNYINKTERPLYTKAFINNLASDENIEQDKQQFIQRLNNWKARQNDAKPIMYIINTSGGGIRSATFTMNTLQQIDSLMNGDLMKKTFLINGASGGLLGAAYYRELYNQKQTNTSINMYDKKYVEDISKDLLNPIFSSFVSRDIIGPVQKFTVGSYTYAKDRGYAFEQKLNDNTHGILNKKLSDYAFAEDSALLPTMFFNSVISQDGRKMIACTKPVRFLMRPQMELNNTLPVHDIDAIDFNSFFAKQNSSNFSVLSALRMNATFPYVLPNVWLPTEPVVDVMDAGLRDNFGQETSLRFIQVFKDWLQQNTSKVVIIQIRDRSMGDWQKPEDTKSLFGSLTEPAFLLQNNWFKLQDFYQQDQVEYFEKSYGQGFYKILFQYSPLKKSSAATLSFHLTTKEKLDILSSLNNNENRKSFDMLKKMK